MRRNNRRSKKLSVAATRAAHIGTVMIVLFVMIIFNFIAKSNCDVLIKESGTLRQRLKSLENAREVQCANWDAARTHERLNEALARWSLKMDIPKVNRVVRMRADGTPLYASDSVTKRRQGNTARYRRNR